MKIILVVLIVQNSLTDLPQAQQVKPLPSKLGEAGALMQRDVFNEKLHMHGMTNLEVMEVFTMADVNRDGLLSSDEWDGFYKYFVTPFEGGAPKQFMTKETLKTQFQQPWFQKISVEGSNVKTLEGFGPHEGQEDKKDVAGDIILACDRDLDGQINFAEQLLLRRAAIAWNSCAQETMNRAGLRCGLTIAVRGRQVDQSEADVVFRVGLTLMTHNKWSISFPVFLMLADLYRTFSAFDVPIDNGSISQSELLRHLAEMDIPHRVTPSAVHAIFAASGQTQLQFPLFCFTVIVQNRFYQYSSLQKNSIDNTLDLEGFLALLHDKVVPNYIRTTIDSIDVNVPVDETTAAASAMYNMGGQSAIMSLGSMSQDVEVERTPVKYTEKNYVEIFLQKTRTKEESESLKAFKLALQENGLAEPLEDAKEKRQRVLVYLLLNDEANELLTFVQFYALFRYADLFNLFSGGEVPQITGASVNRHMDKIQGRVHPKDFSYIQALQSTLGSRRMSFKHFLGFMRIENVFGKYKDGTDEQTVTKDDLEQGLTQLGGYPLVRAVADKNKKGTNYLGKQLFSYSPVTMAIIFAEIEGIMNAGKAAAPKKLLEKVTKRDFVDAKSQ